VRQQIRPTGPGQAPVSHRLRVRAAEPADAAAVYELVVRAFRARPALDPPAAALSETPESIASEISDRGGLVAVAGDQLVGALLFGVGPGLRLTRVSVDPGRRRQRIAARLVRAAEAVAAERGADAVSLVARRELSSNGAFWRSLGYGEVDPYRFPVVDRVPWNLLLARAAPFVVSVDSAPAMQGFGRRLGAMLRAGDVVILTGGLGAGKTTLTQGIGDALHVRGPVTSPTFIVAREHPSLEGGPALVHVDGYRLAGALELDDLDLDATVSRAVTVVEWGKGIAEALAPARVGIDITGDEVRTVRVDPVGGRWAFSGLQAGLNPVARPAF